MRLLAQVVADAGITREQLRDLVRVRQAERSAEVQRREDAELLRLGREFADERAERAEQYRESQARRASVARPQKPLPSLPPLIETAGCAAYRCPNAGQAVLAAEFNGRVLRVRYCKAHSAERLAELAAGSLNAAAAS